MKTRTLYNIREFVGASHSKSLSAKLRERSKALKLVKRLKKVGRNVFAAPVKIAA